MKIAVSSTGKTLDSAVEARFGRCPFFLIVNPATLEFEAVANPNTEAKGGVGVQSAQLVAAKGVSVVLTGNCGPNAVKVFEHGGVHIVTGVSGTVLEVVQQYAAGSLKSSPTVADQTMGRSLRGGGGRNVATSGQGRGLGGRRRFR